MRDPYQVLGVSRDASDEEIKKVWNRVHENEKAENRTI